MATNKRGNGGSNLSQEDRAKGGRKSQSTGRSSGQGQSGGGRGFAQNLEKASEADRKGGSK
jgi:hypothetical protein